jgi:hypothetical protein
VFIRGDIKILGQPCFESTKVHALSFSTESRLRAIERSCFCECSLGHSHLPGPLEILGQLHFAHAPIAVLVFGKGSTLRSIPRGGCHENRGIIMELFIFQTRAFMFLMDKQLLYLSGLLGHL